jgi:hypothetical protein
MKTCDTDLVNVLLHAPAFAVSVEKDVQNMKTSAVEKEVAHSTESQSAEAT